MSAKKKKRYPRSQEDLQLSMNEVENKPLTKNIARSTFRKDIGNSVSEELQFLFEIICKPCFI